jgi:hypothetical protein
MELVELESLHDAIAAAERTARQPIGRNPTS